MSASGKVNAFLSELDNEEQQRIIQLQLSLLARFEKTNAMLHTLSELSSQRYKVLSADLQKNSSRLVRLKSDLDEIFKRIRKLKSHFSQRFPVEMNQFAEHIIQTPEYDDDEPAQAVMTDSAAHSMNTVNEESIPE